jgi:hypothetical protein
LRCDRGNGVGHSRIGRAMSALRDQWDRPPVDPCLLP